MTLDHTTLCAELEDDTIVQGETDIDLRGEHDLTPLPAIKRLFLDHQTMPCYYALRAIRRADVIILGPGDLYTSILPNLLVDGITRAIRESEAEKVYVCNLMTKHGETDQYKASDFIGMLHQYLGGRVDRVIIHDGTFPETLLNHYATQGQFPVEPDMERVQTMVPEVMVERLNSQNGDYVRHDPERLIRAILSPYLGAASVTTRFSGSTPGEMFVD